MITKWKHSDFITHIDNKEDAPYLKNKLPDVNMRLFNTSQFYRKLVLEACKYLEWLVLTQMEGYKLPHGMSGANAGIPWNIIAVARDRGEKTAFPWILINPKVIETSKDTVTAHSNCGSLTLKEPITVHRFSWVKISWFGQSNGEEHHLQKFEADNYGFTLQHEIDHNLGILITDRV